MVDSPEARLCSRPGGFRMDVGGVGRSFSLGSGTVGRENFGSSVELRDGSAVVCGTGGLELELEPLRTFRTHRPGVFFVFPILGSLARSPSLPRSLSLSLLANPKIEIFGLFDELDFRPSSRVPGEEEKGAASGPSTLPSSSAIPTFFPASR